MEIEFITPTCPLYRFRGTSAQPIALLQAGIHGDEIAGVHALEEILEGGLRVKKGTVLIIPTMNRPAYRARQRAVGVDLNRAFPGDPDAVEPERRLAYRFMELVRRERPALMATLHESQKRYDPDIVPSFGQSLVYGVDPMPKIVQLTVERLNREHLVSESERWSSQYYPVATSSTEVIVEEIGCIGICVETWMGFEEKRRIEMQRAVVSTLLEEIGIEAEFGRP